MLDTIEYKGDWKVPGSEEWTKGTLTFSPNDGARLELHGIFNGDFRGRNGPEIILGKTTEGLVTLIDCFYLGVKARFDTKITIGQYSPAYILKGKHFDSKNQIQFSKTTFTLFNFFEWLNTTGKDLNVQNSDLAVNYEQPEHLGPYRLDETLSLDIDFSYKVQSDAENRLFSLSEDAKVSLTYATVTNFEKILHDINIFENFVTVAVFEQSYPTSIEFDLNGEKISCYYQSKYNSVFTYRHTSFHILQYKRIQSVFPNVIAEWFVHHKAIEPVFNLLLYSFRDKRKISEDKFMDLCRALEIFHRSVINSTPYTEEQFEHLYKRIVFNAFERDQEWLGDQLRYANNHNLEARIHNLYKRFATKYNTDRIDDKQVFIAKVVATRNYYTHYNPRYKEKAMRHGELYHATKMLTGLLISCIYQNLGISKQLFEDNMNDATI